MNGLHGIIFSYEKRNNLLAWADFCLQRGGRAL